MLGRKAYSREEIDAARAAIETDIRAYDSLPAAAKTRAFEAAFFNREVMLLEYMFVHRLSGQEGKDGNPLNEVRVLSNSLLLNGGKLQIEKLPAWPMSAVAGLKLPVETSLLKLAPGDEVKLSRADFERLAAAFFAEIEKRYG